MVKPDYPVTTAIRFLRDHRVDFKPHLYTYEDRGGTRLSSVALGVPEHQIIKTLVFETDGRKPLVVLMHGDREVSTKQLARLIGAKRVDPCDEATALRHTGYMFGGTSPFGTRHPLPLYAERSMFDLPSIYINGGKRGFLIEIDPADLRKALPVTEVDVAITEI
ncbi:MAG TPA: Cys-tRNA(Pro) deacylase [Bacteroidetes bacterium]|nr:MAG: aminoacyl-tRNA deacylase [Ignavibacteria bacterium GWA2_54_16]HCA81235.1 Cys-tRNA(Pro) deacylase [Bacteroidota bacterium]